MKIIRTIDELVRFFESAKNAKGQYVSLIGESEVKMNKFPKEGERVRIDEDFTPMKTFLIKYHFGASYEKRMAKLLGLDSYTASDKNRVHLVKNVLMQYVSTGNICAICMPENYTLTCVTLNGKELTSEQTAYMERYKATRKYNNYLTIPISKVKQIRMGGEVYVIDIQSNTYSQAV